MGLLDISILPEMSENGMNTAMVVFRHFRTPVSIKERNSLAEWSRACELSKQDLLVVIALWLDESKWFKPDHYLVANGKEYAKTPCPADANTYKALIHDRLVALAHLSNEMGISGAVIDTEMYRADFLSYKYTCHCDYCWRQFGKVKPDLPAVEMKLREEYLRKNRLVGEYRQFAVEQIAAMASQTRKVVEQINSAFQIGGLCLDELNDFTEGLSRGFGTEERPVLVFSEKTYKTGYTDYVDKTISRLKQTGIHAIFVTGILQDKFPVENLPEQYYHSAKNCAGYWIYTMQSLNPGWKPPISAGRTEYWKAIKIADRELDLLEEDENYKSLLKIRPFSAPLPSVDASSIKTESLGYVYKSGDMEKVEPPKIKRSNKLVFIAENGDTLKFTIDFTKHSNSNVDHAMAYLLDNRGNVLSQVLLKKQGKAVIQSRAGYSGSYSLYINNDKFNTIQITGMTHFYSIEAVRWDNVHFYKAKGPVYFFALPQARVGKVDFFVNGPSEGVIATFRDDSGRLLGRYDIDSKTTVSIPLPLRNGGSIIRMDIEARQGATYRDVIVTVESGLGKYVSPFKNGLARKQNTIKIK